ncbi:MAG TPA: T9SS type A sorting domain-containing protein, partial [Flavobacteriales bacterium]|nr:T9SS type A sorting domain-containing protein [Flavobacteriales bacterium]
PGSATLVPNPTSGSFSVQGYDQAITRLTIHNATGQLVQDFRPAQTDRLTLDLSNEANGLYTVRILQGDQHTKLQVMVQH